MATEKIIDYNAVLASKGILDKTIEASPEILDNSIKEADSMPDFIERKEFEQFEKRIDEKFDTLNKSIQDLPNRLQDKIEISNNNLKEEIRKESKSDRNVIIGWLIGVAGLSITVLKAFGLI